METIKIVYIDDMPDPVLDEYLDNYVNSEYKISYDLITFHPETGYESLLNDNNVQTANIIFIDSRLFENKTAKNGKFTGEEFKMVLKKFYPFIEVVVITQKINDSDIDMIKKYTLNSTDQNTQQSFLNNINESITHSIESIKQYRIVGDKIRKNDSWELLLKEKILTTLDGTNKYDLLTKKDIDELIDAFKILQEKING